MPVLSVKWGSDGSHVFSASADKSAMVWDSETGTRVKKVRDHTDVVGDVDPCPQHPDVFVSGSDDGTAMLWDARQGKYCGGISSDYQILSVCYSKDGSLIYTAGIDNDVLAFDARKLQQSPDDFSTAPLFKLQGKSILLFFFVRYVFLEVIVMLLPLCRCQQMVLIY